MGLSPPGAQVSSLHFHPSCLTVPLPHSDSETVLASGSLLRRWRVISEFQYLPQGPVIDFLNTQLLEAVVVAFLPQASWRRWNRSKEPRTDVNFHPISREDVKSLLACESLSWGWSQRELKEEVHGEGYPRSSAHATHGRMVFRKARRK